MNWRMSVLGILLFLFAVTIGWQVMAYRYNDCRDNGYSQIVCVFAAGR